MSHARRSPSQPPSRDPRAGCRAARGCSSHTRVRAAAPPPQNRPPRSPPPWARPPPPPAHVHDKSSTRPRARPSHGSLAAAAAPRAAAAATRRRAEGGARVRRGGAGRRRPDGSGSRQMTRGRRYGGAVWRAVSSTRSPSRSYLPISPHISPYLPTSPHISPYLKRPRRGARAGGTKKESGAARRAGRPRVPPGRALRTCPTRTPST